LKREVTASGGDYSSSGPLPLDRLNFFLQRLHRTTKFNANVRIGGKLILMVIKAAT
jgi:hypothetical protein